MFPRIIVTSNASSSRIKNGFKWRSSITDLAALREENISPWSISKLSRESLFQRRCFDSCSFDNLKIRCQVFHRSNHFRFCTRLQKVTAIWSSHTLDVFVTKRWGNLDWLKNLSASILFGIILSSIWIVPLRSINRARGLHNVEFSRDIVVTTLITLDKKTFCNYKTNICYQIKVFIRGGFW